MSLRWTEEQLQEFQGRKPSLESIGRKNGLPTPAKRSKYGNHKVVVDGLKFDSKKEAARWQQLQMLEKAGKIERLERQKSFGLAPAVILSGKRKPALKYCADFVYYENGRLVVEDVKSEITRKEPVYRIKRHLMQSVNRIEIREI
jgi:hypothetical protein